MTNFSHLRAADVLAGREVVGDMLVVNTLSGSLSLGGNGPLFSVLGNLLPSR